LLGYQGRLGFAWAGGGACYYCQIAALPAPWPPLYATPLHHLHQTCITGIKPASPASNLHHLHQTCITPASPASRVHHAA
jgi:hypothetical protein